MKSPASVLFFLLFCLLPHLSTAGENSTRSVGYTVHHNAIKSDFLSPEVAKAYGLQRSKYRGLVNISVIREVPGTTGTAVPAKITIRASNLMGIPKPINLREVREQDAIYYIDDFPIIDGEIVNFFLDVVPQGATRPIVTKFSRQFYVE